MNANITLSLLVLSTLFFACSTDNKNTNEEKNNEYLIPENVSNSNTKKEEAVVDYYIKPPADSTYTGDAEEKYPNGIVKYKGFYRFGKRHGEWIYFYPNGNLWSESIYNRGKLDGISKVYYPNGKLHYVGFFKKDIKDSIWTYYDTTGKETYIEEYKNGKLIKRFTK